jgi:hypothetical protein
MIRAATTAAFMSNATPSWLMAQARVMRGIVRLQAQSISVDQGTCCDVQEESVCRIVLTPVRPSSRRYRRRCIGVPSGGGRGSRRPPTLAMSDPRRLWSSSRCGACAPRRSSRSPRRRRRQHPIGSRRLAKRRASRAMDRLNPRSPFSRRGYRRRRRHSPRTNPCHRRVRDSSGGGTARLCQCGRWPRRAVAPARGRLSSCPCPVSRSG